MTLSPAPSMPLDKVEWRVDSDAYEDKRNPGRFRCQYVPYIDARDAMALLDEWVPGRWGDSFRETEIGGKPAVVCTITIKVGDEWVSRSDVGVPSQFESQKGAFSDSFKRAATKWGCARNVYDLPTLYAPCGTRTRNGKTQAFPNEETLPDLLRQLKALGFDADGGRVQGGDAADTDQASSSEPDGSSPGDRTPGRNDTAGGSPPDPPADQLCPGCETDARDGRPISKVDGVYWHTKCRSEASPVADARKALAK